jgi:ribosomal-protein-alanine N-acetyltransferase
MINLQFPAFPQLTTERLLLRPLHINDAEAIKELRSNKQVNEFINRSGLITLDEAKQFISKIEAGVEKNGWFYWAISLKEQQQLIGTICLWNTSVEKEMAELGYELNPAFHGKGYMQEAVKAIIQFSFEQIQLKILTALPKAENLKSIQVLLKHQFTLDENNLYVSKEDADGMLVYYLENDIDRKT